MELALAASGQRDAIAIRAACLWMQACCWPAGAPLARRPCRCSPCSSAVKRGNRRWLDIPYHYVIDLDGRIYAGRDIAYAGDTNTEYDLIGHALIEVVGNFEAVEPNRKQLDAVVDLMAMLAVKYKVPAGRILSHKEYTGGTV